MQRRGVDTAEKKRDNATALLNAGAARECLVGMGWWLFYRRVASWGCIWCYWI